MAESLAGAAEEAAEGITQIAVHGSVSYLGGEISITINSNSAQLMREACITAVTLGAIYAGYKLIAKAMDGAVTRALGGERDDQEIRDIKPGCLHVLLHCFTDQRLLDVLEDFKNGRMKDCLEKEFWKIGVEVEGLKVEIDNIEEVEKRKRQILSSKNKMTECVDVSVDKKESSQEAKTIKNKDKVKTKELVQS